MIKFDHITYSINSRKRCYMLNNIETFNHVDFPHEIGCNLYLSKNKFCLSIVEFCLDIMSEFIFSCGNIKSVGRIYYLSDTLCSFKIILELNKDESEFIIKRGMSFMKNRKFYYAEEDENIIDEIINRVFANMKKTELHSDGKESEEDTPLILGFYENTSVSLFLDYDFHYQICFILENYLQPISEGVWTKIHNKLLLYDPFLEHSFTAFIYNDKIEVLDFPKDLELKRNILFPQNKMLPFIMR